MGREGPGDLRGRRAAAGWGRAQKGQTTIQVVAIPHPERILINPGRDVKQTAVVAIPLWFIKLHRPPEGGIPLLDLARENRRSVPVEVSPGLTAYNFFDRDTVDSELHSNLSPIQTHRGVDWDIDQNVPTRKFGFGVSFSNLISPKLPLIFTIFG